MLLFVYITKVQRRKLELKTASRVYLKVNKTFSLYSNPKYMIKNERRIRRLQIDLLEYFSDIYCHLYKSFDKSQNYCDIAAYRRELRRLAGILSQDLIRRLQCIHVIS